MSVLLLFPKPPVNAASGGRPRHTSLPTCGAAISYPCYRLTRRPERVQEIRALSLPREIGAVAYGVMEGAAVLIGLGIAEIALVYMLF